MHYEVHGRSDAAAPTLLLSSGLGGSASYWAPQIEALQPFCRIVAYDHRGTGRSGGKVPADGGIAAMANDVLEIVETLKLERFHFAGHALGGLIGLQLALQRPDLVQSLVLINAWARADPHSGRCFDIRIELLEKAGVAAFVKAQPLFLYPAVWMAEHAERLTVEEAHAIRHFQGRETILRRIAALRSFDVEDRIGNVMAPALVIAARDDLLVPYTRSLRLAEALPHSELLLLDHGAHAVNVTEPASVNAAMLHFLQGQGG
ncbi:pyrimidine utilization protein D [Mangrovicella endophytica]|uniref:pyrimidine utilization protein D n=1 Tax=Mangrovicella endophytica TaxID=2066697 RepID=UPI000C9E63AA|nr:pyrimidine utilization protein D [Mangrovicella endophytica]